jgi:hypothetical protein
VRTHYHPKKSGPLCARSLALRSPCAHSRRRRASLSLSLLPLLNIRQSACVFFLAQLLLLLFKLTPPPPPEFAAAHMCTCHLYLLGPRNQSRSLSPRFVWRRCCILRRLSLCVYVEIYMCAFARERAAQNVSLAANGSCSLLMRGCAVCARGGAFISVIAQIHAGFMEFELRRSAGDFHYIFQSL